MTIESLPDAVKQVLVNGDTRAIKYYLRQGACLHYLFPPVTNGLSTSLPASSILSEWNIHVENCRSCINLNFSDSLGNVLLHRAAELPDSELIRLLLVNGADITSRNIRSETALHIACQRNSLEVVRLLAENTPAYILNRYDSFRCTPLGVACRTNTPEVVRYLLSLGSSVVVQPGQQPGPLLEVAWNIKYATQIASLILDAGANIDHTYYFGGTLLTIAITKVASERQYGGLNCIERYQPYVDLCMMLMDRGCNVNAANRSGDIALHIAVKTQHESLVRKLLLSGSEIDRLNNSGFTPLYYACEMGNQRIVDLLIICGANLRAQNLEEILNKLISEREDVYLINYIIDKSKQCATLENLCAIAMRKSLRNVEKNVIHLGLPPLLEKRLLLLE